MGNHRPTRHRKASMPALAVIVLFGMGLVMVFERSYLEGLPFAEREITELTQIHQKQVDLFVEQSSLLTTLSSGLLAALGALLLKAEGPPLALFQAALMLSAIALSATSLYFGYLAYQEVIWMLGSKFFNLDNVYVAWARRLQFFAFLASAACGLFFVALRAAEGRQATKK